MTTTIVRDSIVGDDWIQRSMQSVPIQRIVNKTTGEPTGDLLTGPVRLAFTDSLHTLPAKKEGQSDPKYSCALLFPPTVDFALLYEEYYNLCGQNFPEYYDAASGQYHGLQSPFHDQAEKARYGGFTPGAIYFNATSKFKPSITDLNNNPILDMNRVYPGVWAICAINAYPYGKNPPQPKKGVSFGLQNVMIIGDDTKFGGGAKDASEQFSGVKIDAPIVRPDVAQAMPTGAAPGAAPAAGIPGYTQVGGGVAPQAAPPVAAPAAGNPPPATAPVAAPQTAPAVTSSPIDDGSDLFQ